MGERCPELELLAAYAARKLKKWEVEEIEAHLADCDICRQTVGLALKLMDEQEKD